MEHALLTGLGLAAPAGLNAYIPLLVLALVDRLSDRITLAPPFEAVSSTPGLLVLLVLLTIEIVVDKIPGLDHANDLVQSAIRPATGALLLVATAGGTTLDPWLAGLLGAVFTGSVHVAKARMRPAVTLGTGGMFNPLVSLGEDTIAVVASVGSLFLPVISLSLMAAFVLIAVSAVLRARRRAKQIRLTSTSLRR